MSQEDSLSLGYFNVVSEATHRGELTLETARYFSENFSKPVVLKNLAPISRDLAARTFFDRIDPEKTLQWRVKNGDAPVSMRSEDGESDYNYVTGKTGSGKEFLDDIFEHELDVYSHLGTVSSGYHDPYEWGKLAFEAVKHEIFKEKWFNINTWQLTGHMFLGRSNHSFGEPGQGAVGSDWHMFPTLNVFVMIAGEKRWSTRPPYLGEQNYEFDKLFKTSSGREGAGEKFLCDTIHLRPGDVLLNPPFEWHKVLNAKGFTLGGAFRVIDNAYLAALATRQNLDMRRIDLLRNSDDNEELAHFLTSVNYAAKHINRAQMLLNDIEYAYLRQKGSSGPINIGHQ